MKTLFLYALSVISEISAKKSNRNQQPIRVSIETEMSNVEAKCIGGFLPGFAFSESKNIDFVPLVVRALYLPVFLNLRLKSATCILE